MIKFFLYLIGFCFFLALYGMYAATTSSFYYEFIDSKFLFYVFKIFELLLIVWFVHQVLYSHIYEKVSLGKAFIQPFKLLKSYLGKRTGSGLD